MQCLIIGIGINVNQTSFDGEYLRQPTSAALELGREADLKDFSNTVYMLLKEDLDLLRQGHDFYPEISHYDYLAGRKVFAEINGIRDEVEVVGIDEDFFLKVIQNDEYRNIDAGEITFHL